MNTKIRIVLVIVLIIVSLMAGGCASGLKGYVSVTTIAGGESGYADGKGSAALFNNPADLAVDDQGNLFVTDRENHVIRMISPDGTVSSLAGTGKPGFKDGPVLEAQFRLPSGIDIDSQGNLFVADSANNRIRKISH